MLKQPSGRSLPVPFLEYEKRNIDRFNTVLDDISLTPAEEKTLIWIAGLEDSTVNNIYSVFEKLKG
ncbi:MAG: hypothetical protein PUJ11_04770 [Eubacteriaceae bacterium]|nr:hypothetical protein [Eubacteriaceae bacterium]